MAEQVTVLVRMRAREDSEQEVRDWLHGLLDPTRAEKGCMNYDMHVAPDDPCLFLFYENWESQEDLDGHLQSDHVQNWIKAAEKLLAEPMDLTLWRYVA